MSENKLVKNSIIYAIGDIVPKLFSLITFPILTSYLDPADYGIVNYVNTLNTFLTIIGFLCLNTYYLVYYYKVDGEDAQKKLLGNLSLFVIGLNLVLSIVLMFIGPFLFRSIGSNIDFYPYIFLGVITNFFNILTILPSALYRVKERPGPLTLVNIIRSALTLGLTVVFVVVLHFKATGILITNVIVNGSFSVFFLYVTIKNSVFNINWTQLKEALLFSLPLVPSTIAGYLYTMADRILIDKYVNLTALGIYSTASTFALMLQVVTYGVYRAIEPYFFKTYGNENFYSNFTKVRNTLLYVCVFCASALSIFAKEFFDIMATEKYSECYFYVPIIIVGQIFAAMNMMYSTVLTARGKTKINAGIAIVCGLISVLFNVVFLKYFGITCAAVVSSATYILSYIGLTHFSRIAIPRGFAWIYGIVSLVIVVFAVYGLPVSNGSTLFTWGIKAVLLGIIGIVGIKALNVDMGYIIRDFVRK